MMDVNPKGSKKSDVNGSNFGIGASSKGGDDDESQALLACGSENPRMLEKPRRKVQWLDKNGDKLAEILEFQPSDLSDSDEEDSDSCICTIM